VILDGLVLRLPLDEGTGSTAVDKSGYGNDGTITGASWAGGKFGKALSFTTNDYVIISWDSSLDIIDAFTICMKAKWTTLPSVNVVDQILISQQDGAGTGRSILFGRKTDDNICSYLSGADFSSGVTIVAGEWYDIVLVYDGADLIFYINGDLKAQNTQAIDEGATGDYVLGIHKSLVDQPLDGVIDEVRIYDRALSADEVLDEYNTIYSDFDRDEVIDVKLLREDLDINLLRRDLDVNLLREDLDINLLRKDLDVSLLRRDLEVKLR